MDVHPLEETMTARRSPLAPTDSQAISKPGAYPEQVGSTAPSNNTTLVPKGHAKDAGADPSNGTAAMRVPAMERNGAAFRVRHDFAPGGPANEPYSAANGANTPVVQDGQTPTPDKNHAAGTNAEVSRHFAMRRDGRGAYGVR
jgi:hypothetical protein